MPSLIANRRALLLAVLASSLAPAARTSDEGYQVIVPAGLAMAEMPRAEVARLFLRQVGKWPQGAAVLPVDQSARSPVRQAFTRGVLKQPLPAVEAYWQRQIAAGQAPPPVKTSDAEVLAYVAGTPGAIGYVSAGVELTPGVKALRLKE